MRVINPANGEQIAELPGVPPGRVAEAIGAAERAVRTPLSRERRITVLAGIHDALVEHREALARVITLENGKPIRESRAEVDYAAGFYRYFSRSLEHLEPEELSERPRGCRWTVHRRPAGVAALITPWNFPLGMLAKKLGGALAAGCSVVVKPASATPLSAVAVFAILERLSLPAGYANLLLGGGSSIGAQLCAHPAVRIVSFTGSTEVGRDLMVAAAPHLKRLSLELGGNAPFIVFGDANPDQAAEALVANKFRACGQTCVCTNRVLVASTLRARFERAVVERVALLRQGDGLDEATDIGPLIHTEAFDHVGAMVDDALAGGAVRLHGAVPVRPAAPWGAFFPATVLTGIKPEMRVWSEEIFGPVVGIRTFDSEQEALAMANDTVHGLAAYFFTEDAGRAARFAEGLRFGHVGWNTSTGPTPEAPFGGMKASGFGREGGLEGLLEFCESQVVTLPLR